MLNYKELKEIAKIRGNGSFFLSLYLNVSLPANVKDNYVIHLKNMLKNTADKLDKKVLKKVSDDFEKVENYIISNKRLFKKGLAIISCNEKNFWKEFHLSVPFKNEIVVDNTPYIKPLLDILDNYQRYAVLLVGRDAARLFLIHLGEIEEYSEIHTEEVPGRHKKGGWFALAEKNYERHIDYHVEIHLKEVIKKLEDFLSREYVGRILIGGTEEAVTKLKSMLPQAITERIIGTFQAEMFANNKEILEKVEPILQAFEKKKEEKTVEDLISKAMKNENAVIGLEDVLNALQEGRIMKLVFQKDYKHSGLLCKKCGYMTIQSIINCPYCRGDLERVNYIIDFIAQKAVEQGALIEVVSENKRLEEAGNIGAFLRF